MKNTLERKREKSIRRMVMRELPYFWLHCIVSGVIALLIQIIGLIPPIIMQRIIDNSIPSKNTRDILIAIIWFCAIPLLSTALTTFYKYRLAIVCRKFGQQLSIRGFRNLVYQPISYFDHENSSELATYCRNEALSYVIFWVIDIPQLISAILGGLIIWSYILHLNWGIAIILLLYIPFSFLPSNFFANRVKDLGKRIVANNAAMAQIVNDTFKGIKFVKSMVLEKIQIKKLEAVNADSISIWSRASIYDNLSGLWINSFSDSLFTGISFGIAALLIIGGYLSLGMLVVILNYTAKYLESAKKIAQTNYHFKQQLGQYDKLFDILTMNPMESTGHHPCKFQNKICYQDVYFAYEPDRGDILKGLNLEIQKGEWLGIMGHSGAGKTTVFDLLLRFYPPGSGTIAIDDVDIQTIDCLDLRSKITKVSQDTFLFPGSIRENLTIVCPNATDIDLWRVLESVRLKDFIGRLADGLDTQIGENGLLLSGGERQRLGLAQGLLRNSEIILLDEVTANIDTEAENMIMRILYELKKERGLTIISISHRLEFLA